MTAKSRRQPNFLALRDLAATIRRPGDDRRAEDAARRAKVLARLAARAPIYDDEYIDTPPIEWRVVRGVRRAVFPTTKE